MIKPICRNLQILSQKARPAGKQDIPLAKDLLETLAAHSADCVGMAANMIGAPRKHYCRLIRTSQCRHAQSSFNCQKDSLPNQRGLLKSCWPATSDSLPTDRR